MIMENVIASIQDVPSIVAVVQFGSSISGDTYSGSDIDLLIVVENDEEKMESEIRKRLGYEYQSHFYTKDKFRQALILGEPLALSIVHRGKALRGHEFIKEFRDYQPTEYTVNRCMLNSFAALGLALSDYLHGLFGDDVINGLYHASRSSIWATLLMQEITPPNKRVLELLKDETIKENYKEILAWRENIPEYESGFELEKKIWLNQHHDLFTAIFHKAHLIIKINYKKITGKDFVDFFEVMGILREKYPLPDYYSVFLSVDWDKLTPHYDVMLSFKKNFMILRINAHDGSIIEITTKEKEVAESI